MLSIEEFTKKMKKVAGILEYELHIDENSRYGCTCHLTKEDEKINIDNGRYNQKDRLFVSVTYPRSWNGEWNVPYNAPHIEITMTETKTPEQIARDIEKRVFPEYRKLLVEVVERNTASLNAHNVRVVVLERLAKAIGIEYNNIRGMDGAAENTLYVYNRIKGLNAISVGYGGEVNMNLEIDANTAEHLIEFLKIKEKGATK